MRRALIRPDIRAALAGEFRGEFWRTAALLALGAIVALTVAAETGRAFLTALPA